MFQINCDLIFPAFHSYPVPPLAQVIMKFQKISLKHGLDLPMISKYFLGFISKPPNTKRLICTILLIDAYNVFSQTLTFQGHHWLPQTKSNDRLKYMKIEPHSIGLIDEPFSDQMKLWESLNIE